MIVPDLEKHQRLLVLTTDNRSCLVKSLALLQVRRNSEVTKYRKCCRRLHGGTDLVSLRRLRKALVHEGH